MYQFQDKINTRAFFWFKRKLIENMNWAMLSTAAKAVYPVIACHVHKDGKAYPGEERISALAGVTQKVVRKGILGLEGFPGFSWHNYVTRRGRRSKIFFIKLPQEKSVGEAFPFHQAILESGNWRMLSPSGKALYPVMRNFSYFDINEYLWFEELHGKGPIDFDEVYPQRKYDFCDAEKCVMAEYAGINRRSINNALESLKNCHLIEKKLFYNGPYVEVPGWKVFLRDNGYIFKRSHLNANLKGKNYRS